MTAVAPSPSAAGPKALDAADLFERYGQELYRFCHGRLRNAEDAADAIQNTFLRVHVALAKGTVPQFEAAWLYKIAHNVCLSRLEQSGRRAQHERPTDFDDIEFAAPEHDHDRLEGLADALSELPHKLRQSLLLREWQGLSYAEIADALDTTVPAVETLLYRARKQLADALERGGRKVRTALGALVNLLGVRALLSSTGAAKLAVGAALIAAGGAGIGTAAVVSRTPTPRVPQRATPAAAPVRGLSANATPAASLAPRRAIVVAPSAHQVVAPPSVAQPAPKPQATPSPTEDAAPSTPPAPSTSAAVSPPPAPVVDAPQVPSVTVPSVQQAPSPPVLPSLPSVPQLPGTPTLPNLGG